MFLTTPQLTLDVLPGLRTPHQNNYCILSSSNNHELNKSQACYPHLRLIKHISIDPKAKLCKNTIGWMSEREKATGMVAVLSVSFYTFIC
jgi:hypothetical protein